MGKLKHILIGAVIVTMAASVIAVNTMIGDSRKKDTLNTNALSIALQEILMANGGNSSFQQIVDRLVMVRKPSTLVHSSVRPLYEKLLADLDTKMTQSSIAMLNHSSSSGEILTPGEEILAEVFDSLLYEHRNQAGNIMRRGVNSIGAVNYFFKTFETIAKEQER